MSKHFTLLSLVLSITLTGCATTQYVQPEPLASKDSARIEIERPSSLWGAAISAPVYINNKKIGILSNGGSLTWVTRPGEITVSTMAGVLTVNFKKNHASTLTFNAQKNKTYHLQVTAPYQIAVGIPAFNLEMVNP
jgi:hypothetical protein